MAYIRIPTGIRTITATISRKSYIQYQCYKCGNTVLYEYLLSKQGSNTYHVFQSDTTKQNAESNAEAKAIQLLDRQDDALFNAINVEHNYELIAQKVKCPYCKEIQPWSKVPLPWKKAKGFGFWILGMVLLLLYTIGSIFINLGVSTVFAVFTVLVALLPCIRSIRRKKTLRNIQDITFTTPIYYNKHNIHELIEQLNPNVNQAEAVNTLSEKLRCPNCGAELKDTNIFCGNCGFKVN